MPSLKRPGVYAEEVLTNPQSSGTANADAFGVFLGANNRGPVTPTLISTWQEYLTLFGAYNGTSYLPFALFQFFGNGGTSVFVQRVVGTGAATATRTLLDRGGTPLSTLKIDAVNPGAWANSIYIDIADFGISGTGRFSITVHYGSASDGDIVERWTDLSMNPTDSRYVASIINAELGGGSNYIKVTNLASTNAYDVARPAVQAGTVLAAGADGSAAASSDYISALTALDAVTAPFVLNLPGVVDTPTLTAALNYATARKDVFVVCDPQANRTSTQVISDTQALPVTDFGGVYWPWIIVNDPSVSTPGITRHLPPGGSVVGQILNTDATRGVWKAPAGMGNRIAGAVGLELKLTNTDLDNLRTATPPVNAIRNVPGGGVCVFGANTLNPATGNSYVPIRRTLIYLRKALTDLTTFAVFEPNTPTLWANLDSTITTFLTALWSKGGLVGTTAAQAFYVKVDSTNNTNATIQNGQVIIEIGVSLVYPAEYIVIRIGQSNGGASVTESA